MFGMKLMGPACPNFRQNLDLDRKTVNNVERKGETFSGGYKKLTGKDVNSEFPEFRF